MTTAISSVTTDTTTRWVVDVWCLGSETTYDTFDTRVEAIEHAVDAAFGILDHFGFETAAEDLEALEDPERQWAFFDTHFDSETYEAGVSLIEKN